MIKQFLPKCFVIFLVFLVVACAAKEDKQPKIRIVDLDGKSHSVVTKVPELNKQALVSQGVMVEQQMAFNNENSGQNISAQASNLNSSQPNIDNQAAPNYGILAQEKPPIQQNSVASEVKEIKAGNQNEPAVEYDLSSPEEDSKVNKKKPERAVIFGNSEKSASASKKGLFVQVGAFSNEESAEKVLAEMKKFHKGRIEFAGDEKKLYRVLLGPFSSKDKALVMVKKIKASGREAVLMKNR